VFLLCGYLYWRNFNFCAKIIMRTIMCGTKTIMCGTKMGVRVLFYDQASHQASIVASIYDSTSDNDLE